VPRDAGPWTVPVTPEPVKTPIIGMMNGRDAPPKPSGKKGSQPSLREKPGKKPASRGGPARRAGASGSWLNVYWLSFGACLAVAFLLIGMAPRLAAYGLTGYVVYLVLIPLGLGAAAFLFGAMRSLAEYQGTLWFGTLRLGGPVVVFAMVVLGGLILPKPSRVQAVIHVFGPGGSDDVIRQGTVRLTLGQSVLVQPIDQNGAAYFPDLSSEFLGAPIEVSAQVEGYRNRPSEAARTLPPNGVIRLDLDKIPTVQPSTTASGTVLGAGQRPLAGAVINVENGLATTTTDSLGNFHLKIPRADHTRVRLMALHGGKVGYDEYVLLPGPWTILCKD
jgi:hypothetical protein